MKKNLLIIFMCISMVFMAVSCDDHIHTYSEDWTSDETHHWHAATCEHKDEKYGYAEHTFEVFKENAESEKLVKKCTVCEYVSKDEIKEGVLVSNAEELQEAVKKEGTNTVYLANDMEITGGFSFSKSLTLDLNGKKLSLKRDKSNIALWVGDFSNTAKINVTIKNGTLEAEAITKEESDVWDYYLIMVWKENTLTLENITYNSNTDTDYKTLFYVSTGGGSYIEGESLSPTLNIINSNITTSSEFGVYIPQERHYTNFATLYIENSNITNNATNGKAVLVNNAKVVVKGEFDISKIDSVYCSIKRHDSTVYYGTLETAVYDATEGETITLLKDVDLTNYKPTSSGNNDVPSYAFTFAKNVTLDMNGKTITSNNASVAYQGDGLLIKNGKFVCTNGGSYSLFIGDGACYEGTESDNDFTAETKGQETAYYKLWSATVDNITCVGGINVFMHKLTVKSTECTEASGTDYYALWTDEQGRITVEGGTFTSPSTKGGSVLHSSNKGEIYIKGGTFTASETAEVFARGASTTIKVAGGTFNADPTSFLEKGYKAEKNESAGTWTVVKEDVQE